jgi:hypothetical protein
LANSILGHFDFTKVHTEPVLLNPASGEVMKNPNISHWILIIRSSDLYLEHLDFVRFSQIEGRNY